MEAIAILVGLAGVAATFSAQTLARTKEFGMLRHLGVTRRQIIAMLLMEGALLGAVGVIAGIGLGLAMSQVLIHVVNPQSFNWTMETRLPFTLFATVAVALIAGCGGHGGARRTARAVARRRSRGQGGLVMPARSALWFSRSASRRQQPPRTRRGFRPIPRSCRASNSAFPRTTARTPISAPSGGTSPDGSSPQDGPAFGFQVTFFRTRPSVDQDNPSAFAAKQVLFAHAAISDPASKRLLHDQRVARAGFGLAEASATDLDVVIDDWSLKRTPDDRIVAKVGGTEFALDLAFRPTQPVLLQGEKGFSKKGPLPEQASHYYSLPHLRSVRHRAARQSDGAGEGNSLARPRMVVEPISIRVRSAGIGWGSISTTAAALMAFQIRGADGSALWAGGTYRDAQGAAVTFAPERCAIHDDAHLALAADGRRSIRSSAGSPCGCQAANGTGGSRRCSTIRSSTAGAAAARSTGRVRPQSKAAAAISN